ncbi:MAG: hypothetical protein Q7T45_06615 [Bradyrhizobium sp.]|uniref:hypothetical protein n=1 Tax=Bradyrhizobium sp. TaxID=376 RepID=UPI002718CA0C|nr:hypothetical protein [Bradyrhizobium sp.]MDO8397475.1 hypothetical protein [Bradyrhizobium sp.]
MNKFLKCTAALFVLLTATEALARGAAASIMSSPGYQRRLQESRGYVPNQSGSVLSTRPARVVHPPKKRHRH